MSYVPKDTRPEDSLESFLQLFEIGSKASSFIVPSMYKQHGNFLSEVLYACGNFASTIRKLYHGGYLLTTLTNNTSSFIKKFLETFEVVFECSAYKFGSKQIKWTVILMLQALKLLLSLYLTHVRQIVLDDSSSSSSRSRRCRCPNAAAAGIPVGIGGPHQCQNRPRLAELFHAARPLVHASLYVWLGRDSWLPWCASVTADVMSLICLPSLACLSRRQVQHRADWMKAAALAYAFRTPFHDRIVQPFAVWLAECPVPVMRSVFKVLLTYLIYWRLHYMNMWG